jgi:hypothetical protein
MAEEHKGHNVDAIVARFAVLKAGLASLHHAHVIPLAQGLGLAHVTDELLGEINSLVARSGEDLYPQFHKP